MELDFKQLVYLLRIARHGSFSRAAQALKMSQPALSNSITQLERKVGSRVLTRGRSGASLTESGEMLARHAELIEVQMARAAEELRQRRASSLGPLVIGMTPVAAADLVPRALVRLRQEMPNVSVSMRETVFNEAVRTLLKGEIDLMVGPIGVYPTPAGIVEERLATDPFGIVVRSGHALERRRALSLRQLQGAEWVLPNDQSAYHRQIESLFMVAGLGWPVGAIETNSMTALKTIVMHGDCIAVMPKQLIVLEERAGLLRCIRLVEAGATRALGLSWAKDRKLSPLTERFAAILREYARSGRRRRT
jgi:molybdate transport repressor ModE-like protein